MKEFYGFVLNISLINFVDMKYYGITFLLIGIFSFGQDKDSVSIQKFDLNLNSTYSVFNAFDLNLKIKSWDDESWEEKQKKKQRYEHLGFPDSMIRHSIDGMVEGILNRLISKK